MRRQSAEYRSSDKPDSPDADGSGCIRRSTDSSFSRRTFWKDYFVSYGAPVPADDPANNCFPSGSVISHWPETATVIRIVATNAASTTAGGKDRYLIEPPCAVHQKSCLRSYTQSFQQCKCPDLVSAMVRKSPTPRITNRRFAGLIQPKCFNLRLDELVKDVL